MYLHRALIARNTQCDQGGEFKKALCGVMNIKFIYSHPRRPESQGKVEC